MNHFTVESYKDLEGIAEKWTGKVCLFGGGAVGRTWGYDVVVAAGFQIDFYCDNHIAVGTEINGTRCVAMDELLQYGDRVLVFITTGEAYQAEIHEQLLQSGIKNIIRIDCMFKQRIIESVIKSDNKILEEKYESITNIEKYLKTVFKYSTGYELDLDNPQTLCEKLNWLKIHDQNPAYTKYVDKYAVKKWVGEIIGTEYVIPLYGAWEKFDDIDFDSLPDSFVLKCTHDSGSGIVVKDKSDFDREKVKEKFDFFLNRNYYYRSLEWPYKNVKPRIIAEKYIDNLGKPDSIEYKVTCFNGDVGFVTICKGIAHDTFDKRTNNHFDPDFNELCWYVNYKNSMEKIEKPEKWNEIINLSKKLAANIPYVRVDWYLEDNQLYFGEMTFYTWGGFMKFNPPEWDRKLGEMLDIEKNGY